MSLGFVIPSLLMQFIIASMAYVQVGCCQDLSMQVFSQVSSIAWFLASMSKRSIPPLSLGFLRFSRLMPRGVLLPFQRKFRLIEFIDSVTMHGIPCAFVRNCVMPSTVICIIRCFASRVGLEHAQQLSLSFILSRTVVHGWASSILFPIQAPRMQVGWPSVAIRIPGGRRWSSGCICHEWITLCLCISVPMGIISVFSRLNFAPDARYHFSRMCSRSEQWLVSERYTVVSSAYRLTFTVMFVLGMLQPVSVGAFHI